MPNACISVEISLHVDDLPLCSCVVGFILILSIKFLNTFHLLENFEMSMKFISLCDLGP